MDKQERFHANLKRYLSTQSVGDLNQLMLFDIYVLAVNWAQEGPLDAQFALKNGVTHQAKEDRLVDAIGFFDGLQIKGTGGDMYMGHKCTLLTDENGIPFYLQNWQYGKKWWLLPADFLSKLK